MDYSRNYHFVDFVRDSLIHRLRVLFFFLFVIDWLNWSDTYLDSVFFFLNISTILLEIKKEEEELRDPTKRKFLEEMLFGVWVAHTRIALWPPPCDIDSILSVLLNLPTPFHKRKKKITQPAAQLAFVRLWPTDKPPRIKSVFRSIIRPSVSPINLGQSFSRQWSALSL